MAKLRVIVKRLLIKATCRRRSGNTGETLAERNVAVTQANTSDGSSKNIDDELIPQPQPKSILLGKLPPEIRTLIWSEMRQLELDFGVEHDHLRLTKDCRENQLISTLFTCRQSYLETVEIIYSMCTFRFKDANYFPQFHETLSPNRLDSLQNIHLVWPLSELPKFNPTVPRFYQSNLSRPVRPRLHQLNKLWKTVWLRLSAMNGLRKLYVRLDVPDLWKDIWDRYEVDMFKSIPRIKVPDFVISVSWGHRESSPVLGENEIKLLSFRIIRDV